MSKIPALSSDEMISYTTSGKSKAVITVGIIKDGQASYTVYGEDGKELPHELQTYETLLNQFAQDELGLVHTQIFDKSGDLGEYWY